jgi:hypothetical protein
MREEKREKQNTAGEKWKGTKHAPAAPSALTRATLLSQFLDELCKKKKASGLSSNPSYMDVYECVCVCVSPLGISLQNTMGISVCFRLQ